MNFPAPGFAYPPKRIAKDFQKLLAFVGTEKKLSWCQELTARALGHDDWYGLTHRTAGSAVNSHWNRKGLSTAAMEDFGVSKTTAGYLASQYANPDGHDHQTVTSVLEAISLGAGRDHFTISLEVESPNCGKIAFHYPGEDECRWEPVRRPALLECLKALWEQSPGKTRGDTRHHRYYVGGSEGWKIDAFPGVLVLVGRRGHG